MAAILETLVNTPKEYWLMDKAPKGICPPPCRSPFRGDRLLIVPANRPCQSPLKGAPTKEGSHKRGLLQKRAAKDISDITEIYARSPARFLT